MVPSREQSNTAILRPRWRQENRPAARNAAPRLSLRRNFLWSLAGNLFYAACQWGVVVCLAKLGSPEIVGRFGLGLAITGPVILFSQLQLRAVLATDSKKVFGFGDYLALRLILMAVALAFIATLAWMGGYAAETVLVVLAVGLGKAAESIADVYYAWFQQHERMERIARALMLQGVLSLAAVGGTMAMGGSSAWAAGSWAAAAAVSLWLYIVPSARRLACKEGSRSENREIGNGADGLRPRWCRRRLAKLAWLTLPLGGVTMLVSLQMNIPRYYLEAYRGETELGIYTALAYPMIAGNVVMLALGHAANPRLARHYAAGDQGAFRRLLMCLLGIGFVAGVAGLLLVALVGAPLLRLLYTPEYAKQVGVLGLLMTAAAIGYFNASLGDAMTAARFFRMQVPLFILVTLATLAACWLWIPSHGMQGAAAALIVAGVVRLLASGLVVGFAERNLTCRR